MDVHGGARGRYSTARLHVQDPGRYDDRRRRRSQASQPRGTGPSHRSQVRDLLSLVDIDDLMRFPLSF